MQKQQATNFGLDIQAIHGPRAHADLADHERIGHDLVTVHAQNLVSKGSMELLIAAKRLKEQAEKDGLEVDDSYNWSIRKQLSTAELDVKLKRSQEQWQKGLEQYLWIAADISNAQKIDARYAKEGRDAREFQDISARLGFKITPFWELEYKEIVLYEKFETVGELEDGNILEEDPPRGLTWTVNDVE